MLMSKLGTITIFHYIIETGVLVIHISKLIYFKKIQVMYEFFWHIHIDLKGIIVLFSLLSLCKQGT
jgi:hypothetical protein